jgi:hypothetical protein
VLPGFAIGDRDWRKLHPTRLYKTAAPNATLYLHFSGSGGTSIVDYARSLPWMRLPSIAVAHGKDANLGCASGDDADGVANSYGVIAGAGVHVGHNQRCPCSEMYVHAQMYTFWGAQNPVMAALDCPRIEYWVTLRYPIERIFSRVFKPVFTSHLPKLKLGMSADAMRSVLTNHTVHGAQDLSLGWRREFHGAGVAPLNNAYVRGLLGPTVYRLPLGAVTEQHLALAKAQLERIDIVLPLPNISQLPELLGRHLGRCMTAKVEHKRSGGSTSDSASGTPPHATRRCGTRSSWRHWPGTIGWTCSCMRTRASCLSAGCTR